jgi:branched-chain amino acid transport system substrate-binding protein
MMRLSFRSAFGVAAAFGIAAALALPTRTVAADPFVINVILPLTGPASFIGLEERQALDLLADKTNRGGGIRGRMIQFSVEDDQSNPQLSVQLLSGLIAKKVSVVVGSSSTGPCGAMMPLIAESGPLMYCLSPGLHPAPNTYAFSSSVSTKDELIAIARYSRGRNWKKIALITSTDATGQDAERSATDAFSGPENKGAEIVAREHFNVSDISTTAQLSRIKAANPDLIIAWTTGTPFGTILRSISDVGIKTPIVTTDGNETYVQMKQYASFMPANLYFPAKPALVRESADNPAYSPALRKQIANYFAAFREHGVEPDNGQSLAWDPGNLVLDAFRQLGFEATAAQLKAHFEGLHGYTGVAGEYDFRDGSQRGLTQSNAMVVHWNVVKNRWDTVSKLGGEPLR